MNRKINIILFTAVLLHAALASGETDLQQTYSEFTAAG